ncbi:MAG: alpha/beta fold hydrolase [Kouleothrix sp.]|nr:alpha/beta fold hydrolase [Kouleothrix sp.]
MCLIVPLGLLAALIAGAYLLTPLRERLTPREFAGDDRFVRVGGYDIHYADDGPREAAPVVLLHGFGAWSFTWRAQRQALLAAGHRVIAADQIGYGASSRPAAPVYTTRLQADLTLGALDALGVGAAHFVGHSFGGRVAMQIAIVAPERVRSLVVVSPEAFATERPPIARWVIPPLLGYALAFYSTGPRLVRPGLKYVSKLHDWLTEEAVRGYAAPTRVRGSAAAQVWQARSPKDGAQPVPANLPAIAQRTLVIWGADDPVFPAADGRRLAQILPNATLHEVAGAGHLPHEERGAEVTAAILEFLKDEG